MRKKIKITTIAFLSLLLLGFIYLFTHVPKLSDKHGVVETKLYLGNSDKQPLFVGFGGGGGGNDWVRNYLKGKRDSLNQKGYAVLAIGYFKSVGAPDHLDRISLDAIRDTIVSIAKHPKIDGSKIILFGGSRGGELVLNLASRYKDFNGVIAGSTSNVSFPAITIYANTSSWIYKNNEVPYVPAPLKTIIPAIKGDLYTAHAMMLEDKDAVKEAEIPVENINGSVLIISGKDDDQWPAPEMSEQIIKRLKKNNYKHYYKHIQLDGGHAAPLEHFNLVYDFLEQHFKVE
ncbi:MULTISPECIES: acyl-CoA thioester hydrolase/BAAT C-terminal domain-containing protein [Aquimarina]|uniref:acyl-CoA thioester hydrolase/BAAT C-terminal domain-containing protein n=1 Tax=Aquimarina TaxID=290174 RepID=UPI000D68F483|nr:MULTISPECIES: acyl-CoA thioester hydrolase/BAAT C-terminal domain-containing protein [Aquimarina]